QSLGPLVAGERITRVDGGSQRRCFTHIDDGIDALLRILKNDKGCADGGIFNIGNPKNDRSIRELAVAMVRILGEFKGYEKHSKSAKIVEQSAEKYYGGQYQDVVRRVPSIARA